MQRARPNDGTRKPQPDISRNLAGRAVVERLGEIAGRLGTRSFLVGGPVRDLILGRAGPDLDVAVEEGCREFGAAVAREFGGRFVYHSRFLTGTVSFLQPQATSRTPQAAGSEPSPLVRIDITQTRAETYERPAVLPAVRPASIVGDLGRRDFTINAMALEITPGSFGEFIDPFDGRADLEQRQVRILNARSFIDDPTRIFRCIRFATRLGFAIEPQTLSLMRSAVEQRLPAFLTPERVLYELRLICAEPLVLPMVKALVREQVLKAAWRWTPPAGFVPAFAKLVAASGKWGQSPGAPASDSARYSPHFPVMSRAELLFIYWLSVLPVNDRFPIRKEERDAAEAVAGFGRLRPRLKRKQKPSDIYRALCSFPVPALHVLAALETKAISAKIRAFLDTYSKVRIASTGADLRGAGLEPGPAFREILDELLFARLDGRIRSVTDERVILAKLIRRLGARSGPARQRTG